MLQVRSFFSACVAALSCAIYLSFTPSSAAQVPSTLLFDTSVNGSICHCALSNGILQVILEPKHPASLREVMSQVKRLRREIKRAKTTRKKVRISRTIKKLRRNYKDCMPACTSLVASGLLDIPQMNNGDGSGAAPTATPTISGSVPNATPTPGAQPTAPTKPTLTATPIPTVQTPVPPTPTRTPVPTRTPTSTPTPIQGGCFTANGDTDCFGIPANLKGNISDGSTYFSANNCSACHSEASRRNKTFQQIKNSFSNSAMSALRKPTDQQVADLTAWLNRFNR
jgi:hypothetical protein